MTALETRFDTILPTLATKADGESLRAEMRAEMQAMRAEMQAMRADMQAMLADMRADLQKMNADVKTSALATLIVIIGTVLVGIFGASQMSRNAAPAAGSAPIYITIPGAFAPPAPAGPK